MRHPVQPVELDAKGVRRFKANCIVVYLLEHGGINMNKLAMLDFSDEDREQFAQLIGYSVSGAGGLGYMSERALLSTENVDESGATDWEAVAADLDTQLSELKSKVRQLADEL